MSQHYSITRDLDDSDDDEEEGSEGTPKDGAVVLAALKPGMKMGNNNFGGQQGMHQDQPSFNQLQFQNPAQVNTTWHSTTIKMKVGDKTIPTK